jgi:hypothetical protein
MRTGRPGLRLFGYALTLALIIAGGAALRFWNYDTAYALNIDELIYSSLAQSIPTHGLVPVTFNNMIFLLHPPLMFLFGTLNIPVDGLPVDKLHLMQALIHQTRVVNLIAGSLSIFFIADIVRRVTTRHRYVLALLAAVVFAVDPFVLRQNGHYLLETGTMLFVLAGYWVLVRAVNTGRLSAASIFFTGLLLGIALMGKDMSSIAVVLPLVIACVVKLRRFPRKRWAALIGVTLIPWASYQIFLMTTQYYGHYLESKQYGIRRALGALQTTGFNAPNSPKLVNVLGDQALTYWPTYLILAAAVWATIYTLVKGSHSQRLLGLVSISTGLQLAFAVAFGAIEEQFLYFLFAPAVVITFIGLGILMQPRRRTQRAAAIIAALTALVVVGTTTSGVNTQVELRTTPDTGYIQAVEYIKAHSDPAETRIAWASGKNNASNIDQFTFRDYRAGAWALPGDAYHHEVTYVITLQRQIEQGYTYVPQDFLTGLLPKYAHVVYQVPTRWAEYIQVWEVDPVKLALQDRTITNPDAMYPCPFEICHVPLSDKDVQDQTAGVVVAGIAPQTFTRGSYGVK